MNWFLRTLGAILGHESDTPSAPPVPASALDSAWRSFGFHWTALDMLDQKASSLLGVAGVIVTLLVSLRPVKASAGPLHPWLFSAALFMMVLCALLAVCAWRVRIYSVPPKPRDVLAYYEHPGLDWPEQETATMLVRAIDGAIDENRPLAATKIALLGWAYGCFVAGLALVAVQAALIR